MKTFNLNGAGITDTAAQVARAINRANSIEDGRFAVIHGLLFDCTTVEFEGFTQSFVSVYDADGAYNASHGEDVTASYKDEHFIVAFEFNTSGDADVDAMGNALFLHLIEHAMRDSNNTHTRLTNFARGLDLDHIATVNGFNVSQEGAAQ